MHRMAWSALVALTLAAGVQAQPASLPNTSVPALDLQRYSGQ